MPTPLIAVSGCNSNNNKSIIYYSSDFTTWTESANDLNLNIRIPYALSTNGNVWVVGGYIFSAGNAYYYSYDLNTWNTSSSANTVFGTSGGTTINLIRCNNTVFLANFGSGVATSPDGITWTNTSLPYAANSFAYGPNGYWLVQLTSGLFYYSSDNGSTWTQITSNPSFGSDDIAYGGGVWVIVGATSTTQVITLTHPPTASSTFNATTGINVSGQTVGSVCYSGSAFYACQSGPTTTTTYYSADGTTWQARSQTLGGSTKYVNNIAYSPTNSYIYASTYLKYFQYSADGGNTWNSLASSVPNMYDSKWVCCVNTVSSATVSFSAQSSLQSNQLLQAQFSSTAQLESGTYQLVNVSNSSAVLASQTIQNVQYNISTTNNLFYSCIGVDNNKTVYTLQYGNSSTGYLNSILVYNLSGTLLGTYPSTINRQVCLGNMYFEPVSKNLYLPTIGYDDVSGTAVSLNTLYWFNTSTKTYGSATINNTISAVCSNGQGNYLWITNWAQQIVLFNISTTGYSTIFDNAVSNSFTSDVFTGCAIANDGNLYVLSTIGNIYQFSTAGTFLSKFATQNATARYTSFTYNSYLNEFYYNYNGNYANPNTILRMPLTTKTSATAYSSSNTWTVSYFPYNASVVFDPYSASVFILVESSTTGTFMVNQFTYVSLFSSVPTTNLIAGSNTLQVNLGASAFSPQITVQFSILYPCFLQGTLILRMDPDRDVESYVPVESLKVGDLIKTSNSGYKAISILGRKTIHNDPASGKNNRLFIYRKKSNQSSGLFADLVLTGDHCALLYNISDSKLAEIESYMGQIYITEGFYRIPANLDERSEPHDSCGQHTIWHFALEHDDPFANYGVYANGLLVESSSMRYMKELSNMDLLH